LDQRIDGFIWLDWVVDKIIEKHNVSPAQVEEAFFTRPAKLLRAEMGKYRLYSRSEDGRYLFIVFVWEGRTVKVISARDMTDRERRYYRQK
jgi:uncharacterized DUF497 family protein